MSALEIRPMRARDVVRFSRFMLPKFMGLVGEKDGQFVAAAAIIIGDKGRPFLCFEVTDEMRQLPVTMHKIALKMAAAGVKEFGDLFTVQDSSEPTSARWLARLGFSETDEFLKGEKIWRRSLQH